MLLWFYKFPTDKLHPPKIKGTSEKPERLWGVSGVGWGGQSISETRFFLNAVPKPTWHTFPDSSWARTHLLQQEPSLFTFYGPIWKITLLLCDFLSVGPSLIHMHSISSTARAKTGCRAVKFAFSPRRLLPMRLEQEFYLSVMSGRWCLTFSKDSQ